VNRQKPGVKRLALDSGTYAVQTLFPELVGRSFLDGSELQSGTLLSNGVHSFSTSIPRTQSIASVEVSELRGGSMGQLPTFAPHPP
jgi:hypothetical protein